MEDVSRLTPDLMAAVREGDLEEMNRLLAGGADPNGFLEKESGRREYVLEVAASGASPAMLQALLAAGADLTWSHAVSHAAEAGRLDNLRFLIEHGARLEWGNGLEAAVSTGQFDAVRLLLDHGADPSYGPMQLAASSLALNPCLRLFLERGVDPNAAWGPDGITPLIYAAGRWGSPAAVKALLAAGADVHRRCDDGDDPLMFAAAYRESGSSDDILELLLRAGADPNALNDNPSVNTSALIAAVQNGHRCNLRTLLHYGADPNITDSSGVTPVLAAVRASNIGCLRDLVEGGADVSVQGAEYGPDAADHAINLARKRCIEFLYMLGDRDGAVALAELAPVT